MAWFAVMTKPRAEELADMSLRLLGIRTFFPHWRERIRNSKLEVKSALFRNYLFVEDPARFDTVVDADGVLYVLPFPVPARVMEEITNLSPDKSGFIPDKVREKIDRTFKANKAKRLRPSDKARVNERSAFFGFYCQVEAILGKRAKVLILNSALKKSVILPISHLDAA
jgi:hypothetical protein